MSVSDLDGRRPRPIGAEEESDDDSDEEENLNVLPVPGTGTEDGKQAASSAAVPTPEEEGIKKKASRKMPAFSENNLVMEKGLIKVYKEFPKRCKYKGRGREAEFLRGLMVSYKEWGYQLFPALAFEDLASRTEKLGGRARVRDLMRELRDEERDRMLENKYGRSAVENVRAREASKGAEKDKEELAGTEEGKEDTDEDTTEQTAIDRCTHGGGAEKPSNTPGVSPAGGLSAEVRERVEANRRLALERLRLRKEEAAAAAAAAAVEKMKAPSAVPAADVDEDFDERDLMELDTRDGAGETGGSFEEDEAALAEMDAQEPATKKPKTAVNYAHPGAKDKQNSSSLTADGDALVSPVRESFTAGGPPGADGNHNDIVDTSAVEGDDYSFSCSPAKGADQPNISATATAPTDAPLDEARSTIQESIGADGGAEETDLDEANIENATNNTSSTLQDVPSQSNNRSSEPRVDSGDTRLDDKATAEESEGLHVPTTETVVAREVEERHATPSAKRAFACIVTESSEKEALDPNDLETDKQEQTSFRSPQKKNKESSNGLAMSPLGRMLASTDTPAEGASMAARSPIAGLFDEK